MINCYQLGWRQVRSQDIHRRTDNILLLIALFVFLARAYFIN